MKVNRLGTGLFDVYDQQRNWYIETMKNIYKSIRKEKQLEESGQRIQIAILQKLKTK